MKKFLISGLIVLSFGVIAFSTVQGNQAAGKCSAEQSQKAGCCSRHGGVCGCNEKAHRLMCCDGSTSRSCGC